MYVEYKGTGVTRNTFIDRHRLVNKIDFTLLHYFYFCGVE